MVAPNTWNDTNLAVQRPDSTINLLQAPALFSPSENRQNFVFEAIQKNQRQTAQLSLLLFAMVPNQEDLIISNALYTIKLKASILAGYNQFRTFNTYTANNLRLMTEDLAYTLMDNTLVAQDYDITTNGSIVIMTAKSTSADYNLTVTLPSTGILVQSNFVGIPQYIYEELIDYNLYADVFVASGHYGEPIDRSSALLVDTLYSKFVTNELSFSVEGLTKSYVDVVLPTKQQSSVLAPDLLDVKGALPVARPYFIRYGDAFRMVNEGNLRKQLWGQSAIRFVLNGALDQLNTYDLSKYILDVENSTEAQWMTSKPKKTVYLKGHEYLSVYFKANTNPNDIYIAYEATYLDGTTEQVYTNLGFASELKGVVSFDVSPLALGLEAKQDATGKLIKEYNVYLEWRPTGTQTFYKGQRAYFKLDQSPKVKCYTNSLNIIFVNELGVWESFVTDGYLSTSSNRQQTAFQKALPQNANEIGAISEEVTKVLRIDSNVTYTVQSGYVTNDYYKWLQRLSDSSTAYIWDDTDLAYRHIVIEGLDYAFSEQNQLGNVALSFSYTTQNNSISR